MQDIRIDRHSAGPEGALVNSYLVETHDGVVAVDGALTVSDGRAVRSQLEALDKPLLAVVVHFPPLTSIGSFFRQTSSLALFSLERE